MHVVEDLLYSKCQIVADIIEGKLKYNCLTYEGKLLAATWFDLYIVNPDFSLIIGKVLTNQVLYGLINPLTNLYIPSNYSDINYAQEQACIVKKDSFKPLYGYISTQDGSYITPIGFTYAGVFHEQVARVKIGNKTGFIHRQIKMHSINNFSEYILAPRAGYFKDVTEGIIHGNEHNEEVWYNKEGKLLLRKRFRLN